MSELGSLSIAVAKVQEALKAPSISAEDKAKVEEMLTKVKGNTINLDLTETPIPVLTEMLKLRDLSARQRKTMFIVVAGKNGNENELLNTQISTPHEFHNAMISLSGGDNADGPNAEIRINGRWYPVHMASEYYKDHGWGDACLVHTKVKFCDLAWNYRFYVDAGQFENDDGERQTYTVKAMMDKITLRPIQTGMQDQLKLVRAADKASKKSGLVVAIRGSVLIHTAQNWHNSLDSHAYGSDELPKKCVVEGTLESHRDQEYYGHQSDSSTILPFVRIFLMDRKRYAYVDVRDCEEYAFDTAALDRLVLEPKVEILLKKIFSSDTSKLFGDVITGKHGGIVILASGSTGVGKTLTAEVFAENTKRPLYTLEMGELGTTLHEVEQNLTRVFHRAARWNAVLLMDEADVFMAKRDDNLERSAIVGVFLRLMDYFPGLFFLTTNRPDIIDPAFASRISIHLQYPDLDDAKRTKIWTMMLKYAKILVKDGIGEIPKMLLNGRNIRNIVRITKVIHPGEKNAEGVEGASTIDNKDLKEICSFTPQGAKEAK